MGYSKIRSRRRTPSSGRFTPVRGTRPRRRLQQEQDFGKDGLVHPLSRIYALLTILYPYDFHQEFAGEMQAVFQEKLRAKSGISPWAAWRVFWQELRDWPASVLLEYWFAFRQLFGRNIMSLLAEDKSWNIEDRWEALLACLPPVLFGFGIALGALVIWEPYYIVPAWRMWTGIAIGLATSFIIAAGGLLALLRRLPAWGYPWAGGAAIGVVVFFMILAEDRADMGLAVLSPFLDILLLILLLLGVSALVLFTAWRGWRQAGLTSLGFATIAGLSAFSMATAAPFNRFDLALLAAPAGLLMSLLTYFYVRKGDAGRLLAILGYGVLNAVMFLVISSAWELPAAAPSPAVPFLVVLTGALLVGPLAGLVGRPVRRVIQGSRV